MRKNARKAQYVAQIRAEYLLKSAKFSSSGNPWKFLHPVPDFISYISIPAFQSTVQGRGCPVSMKVYGVKKVYLLHKYFVTRDYL
jgi:hypothetical protein